MDSDGDGEVSLDDFYAWRSVNDLLPVEAKPKKRAGLGVAKGSRRQTAAPLSQFTWSTD